MIKKLNLFNILISIGLITVGLSSFYAKLAYYNNSYRAQAIITKIGDTDMCQISYRHCKYGRKLYLSFVDKDGKNSSATKELSTITMVAGVFMEGDKVEILYRPISRKPDLLERLYPIKNLGPMLYDNIELNTWHYWAYPLVLVLFAIMLYLTVRKILKEKFNQL